MPSAQPQQIFQRSSELRASAEAQGTTPKCQQGPSRPFGAAFALVVVAGFVVKRSKDGEDLLLLAPLDVLLEGGIHSFSFGPMLAYFLRFREQAVINVEFGPYWS